MVDVDSPAIPQHKVEDIRVWNMTESGNTGRVSATRKNYKHTYSPEPSQDAQPPTIEDVSAPTNPDPSEQLPVPLVAVPKRARVVKENDSVSSTPMPPAELMTTRW